MEHSFIGIVGKTIDPAIRPLGYDWKIGIGLVASFAAREVFVGTLATIYSVGSASEDENIDLIIPRGSSRLVRYIKNNTRIPVMGHDKGLCIIYIDEYADISKINDIVVNDPAVTSNKL